MAAIPPGDPRREILRPAEPGEPAPRPDARNRGVTPAILTVLAAALVVLLIVLL